MSRFKESFSSRFKYVFIDEAQDTSKVQIDIINALFDERVVVQWIGDVNQTIFNYDFNNISGWNPEKNERYKVYKITDSKRISQPIADLIKTVADKPYEELKGTDINIKPTIILYNKDNIKSVLEKFVEIIKEHDLIKISETTGNPIKAVGWRAKEGKALSIRDYFPGYNKTASIREIQHLKNFNQCYIWLLG
jgi:superfamily I DNA/RNA helicase